MREKRQSEQQHTADQRQDSSPQLGHAMRASSKSTLFEVGGLYWVDTIIMRLINNKEGKVTFGNCSKIILQDAAGKGFFKFQWLPSLYSGVGWGFTYKIIERNTKFPLQTVFHPIAAKHFSDPAMAAGMAGAAAGVLEAAVCNIPDVVKIKNQTDPNYFKNKSITTVIVEEQLWKKGMIPTMWRNAFGSFTLFSTVELMKKHIFHLEPGQRSTHTQTFLSALIGSLTSILVSAPFNVVKVRTQASPLPESPIVPALMNVVKQEGVRAFGKGVGLKSLLVSGKQALFMTGYSFFQQKPKEPPAPASGGNQPQHLRISHNPKLTKAQPVANKKQQPKKRLMAWGSRGSHKRFATVNNAPLEESQISTSVVQVKPR